MVDDPMDILYDNYWQSLLEAESLPSLESDLMNALTDVDKVLDLIQLWIRYNGSHSHASPLSHGDIWFIHVDLSI